jgi:hypothetical protein
VAHFPERTIMMVRAGISAWEHANVRNPPKFALSCAEQARAIDRSAGLRLAWGLALAVAATNAADGVRRGHAAGAWAGS